MFIKTFLMKKPPFLIKLYAPKMPNLQKMGVLLNLKTVTRQTLKLGFRKLAVFPPTITASLTSLGVMTDMVTYLGSHLTSNTIDPLWELSNENKLSMSALSLTKNSPNKR